MPRLPCGLVGNGRQLWKCSKAVYLLLSNELQATLTQTNPFVFSQALHTTRLLLMELPMVILGAREEGDPEPSKALKLDREAIVTSFEI